MWNKRNNACPIVTIAVIAVSITLLREVEQLRQNITTPHKRELAGPRRSPPNTNPLRMTLEPGKDQSFLCNPISTIITGKKYETDMVKFVKTEERDTYGS